MAQNLTKRTKKSKFKIHKMKVKYILGVSLGVACFGISAIAQKAAVVSAYMFNKSYERDKDCSELVKGIKAIVPTTTDPKTGKSAKTWYYGGNLFFNAALTPEVECASKFPDALEKSYEYYLNAMKFNIEAPGAAELNLDDQADQLKFMMFLQNKETNYSEISYMRDIMGQKFPYLANKFINSGVEKFQAEDYEKALEFSTNSVAINGMMGRVDSLGVYNAALAAERLDKKEEAIALYTALTEIKYGGADIYLYMANIYGKDLDTVKKIETIRKGLKIYPNNPDLNREELNYLLIKGETEKALVTFDKAISNEPLNASLYYNRGLIYDKLSSKEGIDKEKKKANQVAAAKDYQKAFDIDPSFFDAVYNLGAMYYNIGVEWNNKASNFGLNENDKYEEASKNANDFFMKARPALEKAHSLDPTDKNTMASLIKIYAIEGENELYTKMKVKLQGK